MKHKKILPGYILWGPNWAIPKEGIFAQNNIFENLASNKATMINKCVE